MQSLFYSKDKKAKLVIDNKFGVNSINITINGQKQTFELPREVLGVKRFVEIDISKYLKQGKNTVTFTSDEFYSSSARKGLRLYVELVKKDESGYTW